MRDSSMADRNNPTRGRASESSYSLMSSCASTRTMRLPGLLWRERFSNGWLPAPLPEVRPRAQVHRVKARPSYDCDHCGHHINPLAGTIFHKSSTSLHLWFYAMYMMASTRCGISAKQLERRAWRDVQDRMAHVQLIRNEVMADDDEGPLSGSVEADETCMAGRCASPTRARLPSAASSTARSAKPAQPCSQSLSAAGASCAMHVPSRYATRSAPTLRDKLSPARRSTPTTTSATHGVEREYNPSPDQSLRPDLRRWARPHSGPSKGLLAFKNGVRGVYHSVSVKCWQGYLNEYTCATTAATMSGRCSST